MDKIYTRETIKHFKMFSKGVIFAAKNNVERFEPLATTEKNAKMLLTSLFFSMFPGSFISIEFF